MVLVRILLVKAILINDSFLLYESHAHHLENLLPGGETAHVRIGDHLRNNASHTQRIPGLTNCIKLRYLSSILYSTVNQPSQQSYYIASNVLIQSHLHALLDLRSHGRPQPCRCHPISRLTRPRRPGEPRATGR